MQQFKIGRQALSAGRSGTDSPSLFLRSHQQHGNSRAHHTSTQRSCNNLYPPGRQPRVVLILSQIHIVNSFFFLPPSSFSILLFFFFFVRFISDEKVFGFFLLRCSNLNSFLLSALPSQGRPRGVVHILPPYCVSSFSL